MELSEFLLARMAEDEDAARKCVFPQHGGSWTHDGDGEVDCAGLLVSHPVWVCQAEHIARHDPAHVLIDCEAKRRIVEECREESYPAPGIAYVGGERVTGRYVTSPGQPRILRLLALQYADHPDYRPEWALDAAARA